MALFNPGPTAVVLLLTASFFVVFGQSLRQLHATRQLRKDSAKLATSVDLLERVEGLGGLGRWCIECEPRRHIWSEEMCHLAGLPPGTPPREDILRRIMPDGLAQLDLVLEAHAEDAETFCIEFEVKSRGGSSSILRARAKNIFDADGSRQQVFMVVRDVSEHYAMKRDRDAALEKAARALEDAHTDELTSLPNRRRIMAELDKAVIEARDSGKPLSLVIFDIDHFKDINDRHGHLAGDKVIRKLAEIARRQTREFDMIGRIGGEEFLWILPDCDSQCAMIAAERLRWAVEAGTHSAPVPSITISAGHAQMHAGDAGLLLFARADEALYAAKHAGRNCVSQAA